MLKKPTPGPWKIESNGNISAPNNWVVAKVDGYPNSEVSPIANARLIAAAPELLAACLEFIQCGPSAGHNQELVEQIKSAIAKAKD